MSTEHPRAAPKKGISGLQLVLLAFPLLVLVAVFAGVLLRKWDRDERMKQIERNNVELKQLEIRLKQLEKAVDERQKRGGEKRPEPAKAKPDAAGNKSSQLQRLDWPGRRLVDDCPAMPAVWTASHRRFHD
ncbi:MAG TPA: hypothetical protein VMR25_14935 [Planctomycetaceae bacterium]|jgi:hypothetical protein|nr:hypothetical protein [Planctomycetaceae bacterium]